jgi:diacylglycerol kinase family enzyme
VKAIALINAAAGVSGGDDAVRSAREALDAAGVAADVRPVDGAHLEDAARMAVADGAEMVVVGGGDGSVSAVAGVLAGTEVVLGILPMGTLNHFAGDMGIPPHLEHAARLIAEGKSRAVDVGEVNGRRFVNNASIGLYPHIVSRRERQQERLGRSKWVAMLVAAAWVFRRYPVVTVVLHTGDRVLPRTTPFVFVGNNRYEMHAFATGARARLDGGEVCAYFAHRTGRLGMLALALRSLIGRLDEAKDFETICRPALTVEAAARTIKVAVDGEVTRLAPPLEFRVLPGALRVIAPQGNGAAE